MLLAGDRIELRAPGVEDAELFIRWRSDPEVSANLSRHRPAGLAEERTRLTRLASRPREVEFVVVQKEGSRAIGYCGLRRLGRPNRAAELHIVIGESDSRGRGFGSEALRILCGYGFETLNLHRIGLTVYEYNERARRTYEKAGFVVEGRRREVRYWRGRYWDGLDMGLLESEWRARHSCEGGP